MEGKFHDCLCQLDLFFYVLSDKIPISNNVFLLILENAIIN